MGYNQFIFSSLAGRKSIYIEGIGVVSVIRRGSSKNDHKNFRELPHYDLIVTNSGYDVSLKESVSGDYDEWLKSVTKNNKKGRELDIKGCFNLKINNDESMTIVPYEELTILLNPFAVVKIKPKRKYRGLLFFLLLALLCGGGYAVFTLLDINVNGKQAEVVTVTPEPPKVEVPEKPAVTDSVPEVKQEPEVMVDTVEVVEPKEDASGFTEPLKGNSYLVAGSFRELSSARSDAKRLEGLYEGLKISTTRKTNGDYINYILTTPSYQDALEAQKETADKFDKIKGIWVYYMK